ncbi:MAG: nitrous oxide reductase accessory protein NosL [Phycisphaeraceae bacterium]|nr:nitrous oxide reductase accessory protein NosL [Phycisphaeraceae bacterium]
MSNELSGNSRGGGARAIGGMALFVAAAVCFAALAIVRPAEIGSVQTGIDQCAACGMTIEDSGFAGARVMREGGRTLYYDDLGCMLDAAREKNAVPAIKTFVQDAQDGKWVRAEKAWFVMDAKNRTPMGSGIVAFRTKPAAGAMTFQEVVEKRHAYMKAKYGGE